MSTHDRATRPHRHHQHRQPRHQRPLPRRRPPRPDPGRGRRHRRRPHRLGRCIQQSTRHRQRRRRRRPGGHPRLRRLPLPPGLRGRPHRGVQRPDVRPRRTPPAASAPPSPPPAPPPTRSCSANVARYLARGAAARAPPPSRPSPATASPSRTRPAPCASPPRTPTRSPTSARTSSPPTTPTTRPRYVDLVTGPMLDACAPYARWVDVFCEKGAFDGDQARAILTAGKAKGLHPARPRQPALATAPASSSPSSSAPPPPTTAPTSPTPTSTPSRSGDTVATLLPGAEFSTRAAWPDARRLLDAGATVALSTDCNPGSSFTSSDAVLHRPRRTGHGDDPGRGASGRPPRAAPRPCAAPTSAASPRAPAPTSPCSTRPRTSTSPTGRASRWSPRCGTGSPRLTAARAG